MIDLANFIERVKEYDHSLIDIRKMIRRHSSVIQFTTPRIAIRASGADPGKNWGSISTSWQHGKHKVFAIYSSSSFKTWKA